MLLVRTWRAGVPVCSHCGASLKGRKRTTTQCDSSCRAEASRERALGPLTAEMVAAFWGGLVSIRRRSGAPSRPSWFRPRTTTDTGAT